MSQKLSHEAIDWFVLNESHQMEGWKTLPRWEQWCADPKNRIEYVRVMQLALDLLDLPPPPLLRARELIEDLHLERSLA